MKLTPEQARRLAQLSLSGAQDESASPDSGSYAAAPVRDGARDGARVGGGGGWGGPLPAGSVLGGYRIIEPLARGGMGEVYRAEQISPRRLVAVKVMRADAATVEMRRRFEHEARVLARLNHPGILPVYEAGEAETPTGIRPFIATELVEGEPIVSSCQRSGLSLSQRLELFVKVCDAVEHAHRRGVIHRDLKPSNVLVTAEGSPKVLDFGLARTFGSEWVTELTLSGQMLGTLPYMSPEQLSGDPDDVDTRTDVYALGVMLFEMLTGRSFRDLTGKAGGRAIRAVLEGPRAVFTDADATISADLRTIVGKAVERDVGLRYGGAAELAEDVGRYLRQEPILARRPSVWYEAMSFARRHRAVVSIGAAGVVVLATGLVATAVLASEAGRARKDAEAALTREQQARLEAEGLKDRAAERARVARASLEFLKDVLGAAQPASARGRAVSVLEALRNAEERAERELSGEPEVWLAVGRGLGQTYAELGLDEPAERLLRRSLDMAGSHGLLKHDDAAGSSASLAEVLLRTGRAKEALPLVERASAALDGEIAVETAVLVERTRAAVLWQLGRESEATAALEGAVRRAASGASDASRIAAMLQVATTLSERLREVEAERLLTPLLAEAVAKLGQTHPTSIAVRSALGTTLVALGRLPEAERELRSAVDLAAQVYGPDSDEVVDSSERLAGVLASEGRFDEAVTLYEQAITARGCNGSPEEQRLAVMLDLAATRRMMGDYEGASAGLRVVLERSEAIWGPGHRSTVQARVNLAMTLLASGRAAEAEREAWSAATVETTSLPEDDALRALALALRGMAREAMGRGAEAEPDLIRAWGVLSGAMGVGHARAMEIAAVLARIRHAAGDDAGAAVWNARAKGVADGTEGSGPR